MKLVTPEVEGIVSSITYEGLMTFFDQTPSVARRIVDKGLTAARAREAARKARETVRKGALTGGGLPGQAGRLLGARSSPDRALHCRGRFGRRLRQARPRSPLSSDSADSRQAHQRRESAPRQGAAEHGDPDHDHGGRHRASAAATRRAHSTSPSCATAASSS